MALVLCRECKKEVSSEAKVCPQCGISNPKEFQMRNFILGLLVLMSIPFIIKNCKESDETFSKSENTTELTWQYSTTNDSMAKGDLKSATILSQNVVNFKFPYSGEQRAVLVVRSHPRYGKNIIFSIQKGQLLCDLNVCKILVRFDDEKAISFNGRRPSDHSTEAIFISNFNLFYKKILKSKLVKISTDVYQEGTPTFEFKIDNFDKTFIK